MLGDELAALARDRYEADWIILCDVDEFLCATASDLRTILQQAETDGFTLLTIPRRTMTGRPPQPGERATQALTLRIDRTVDTTYEQQMSGDLPVPFAFLEVGGHVIIRASALVHFGAGAHVATTTWGKSVVSDNLYILHYATRGFDSLCQKVQNVATFLATNSHLHPTWGWHWRRWIRLHEQGRLRDDYDQQFVSPARAEELVREGICVVDDTVARWIADRERTVSRRGTANWRRWLPTATFSPLRRPSL